MKQTAYILPMLLLFLAGVPVRGSGQDAQEPPQSSALVADLAATDPIELEIMDLDAMYWAERIVHAKDVSLSELEANSGGWAMKASTKKVFFGKLKAILDLGKARPLTADEKKKYDDGMKRIRAIMSHGAKNRIRDDLLAVDTIDLESMDLEVRYWAGRIALDKDVTYAGLKEASKNWIMMPLTKLTFFGKLDRALESGKIRPLTVAERQSHDKAKEKIRAILAPGSADEKQIGRYSVEECVEHDGKYWAWRINTVKDVTLAEMDGSLANAWPGPLASKLSASLHRHLQDKETPAFDGAEAGNKYKMDACIEKLKRYSRSGEYKNLK